MVGSITGLVVLLLSTIQILFSMSFSLSDPQLTVLESGFESLKSSVLLSSSFFMMVALFVLFDLELILLFPAVMFHFVTSFSCLFSWLLILVVIFITLLLEWIWFGLKWQV